LCDVKIMRNLIDMDGAIGNRLVHEPDSKKGKLNSPTNWMYYKRTQNQKEIVAAVRVTPEHQPGLLMTWRVT